MMALLIAVFEMGASRLYLACQGCQKIWLFNADDLALLCANNNTYILANFLHLPFITQQSQAIEIVFFCTDI